MLDAHPAPAAPVRAPAASVPTATTAHLCGPQHEPRSKPAALLAAARTLLPVLEAGRALDAPILREAMSDAFGATDAQGAWVWKDAYEAAEAALVLFLQRYGRAMRREAGPDAGGPAAMLGMLETIAALEPSQTRRSEEQIALQQFSTPLPLAYAALQAAAIRPGDVVLEPSAGTGMLAVMAACALGNGSAGSLHLNEIAATRAGLLSGLFPGAAVTRHNAESLRDRLPALRPTVVLMNPPFSASPGVDRTRKDADLRHIRSAFSMLPPGGRLVAISSAHCAPGDAAWKDAFASFDPPARVVFSAIIDGRVYARRGTTFDTRLTVLDRGGDERGPIDPLARVADTDRLLEAVAAAVPARLPIEPVQAVPVPAGDLFGHARAPRRASAKRAGRPLPRRSLMTGVPSPSLNTKRDRPSSIPPITRTPPALRALAGGHHRFPRRGRASHPAGAVRRHGGGAAPGALVPSHAAHADRDRGAPVRCPARERRPRRPGTRAPPRRALPHRRRMGDRPPRRPRER